MTEHPRSYTERCAVIADKLEPHFHVSSLVPTNNEPALEPDLFQNSLMCSWGDPATGDNKLFVYIHQVPNGDREAERLREMIMDEAPPSQDRHAPEAVAYEIHDHRPGEYVFVLNHVGRLTAIASNCVVSISPTPVTIPLNQVSEAALDIGRSVGCSRYVNNFQPPAIDTNRDFGGWTTADGLSYDPRTPPQP
jgi:hypothetical protein